MSMCVAVKGWFLCMSPLVFLDVYVVVIICICMYGLGLQEVLIQR